MKPKNTLILIALQSTLGLARETDVTKKYDDILSIRESSSIRWRLPACMKALMLAFLSLFVLFGTAWAQSSTESYPTGKYSVTEFESAYKENPIGPHRILATGPIPGVYSTSQSYDDLEMNVLLNFGLRDSNGHPLEQFELQRIFSELNPLENENDMTTLQTLWARDILVFLSGNTKTRVFQCYRKSPKQGHDSFARVYGLCREVYRSKNAGTYCNLEIESASALKMRCYSDVAHTNLLSTVTYHLGGTEQLNSNR